MQWRREREKSSLCLWLCFHGGRLPPACLCSLPEGLWRSQDVGGAIELLLSGYTASANSGPADGPDAGQDGGDQEPGAVQDSVPGTPRCCCVSALWPSQSADVLVVGGRVGMAAGRWTVGAARTGDQSRVAGPLRAERWHPVLIPKVRPAVILCERRRHPCRPYFATATMLQMHQNDGDMCCCPPKGRIRAVGTRTSSTCPR